MRKKVTSQERAYRWIRQRLLECKIRSRRDLSLRRVAGEIGVSHVCVDDALNRLEGEGILVSRPRSGTFLRQLSAKEFDHLCDVRECIEPYAAARAARAIKPAQFATLERCCRDMAALLAEI